MSEAIKIIFGTFCLIAAALLALLALGIVIDHRNSQLSATGVVLAVSLLTGYSIGLGVSGKELLRLRRSTVSTKVKVLIVLILMGAAPTFLASLVLSVSQR